MEKYESTFFTERKSCPLCDSQSGDTLLHLPYSSEELKKNLAAFYEPQGKVEFDYLEGAVFWLWECSNCKFVYQRLIPNDELMDRLYSLWIDPGRSFLKIDQRRLLNHTPLWLAEMLAIIERLQYKNDMEILDFGGAWGHWGSLVQALGLKKVSLYEPSFYKAEHAKSIGIDVLKDSDLGFPRFDYIHTNFVFEHLPKPAADFELLVRSLKKGGILRITVPNGGNVRKSLEHLNWNAEKGSQYSPNFIAPLEHINTFTEASLHQLTRGLKEIPVKYSQLTSIPLLGRIQMKATKYTGIDKLITYILGYGKLQPPDFHRWYQKI